MTSHFGDEGRVVSCVSCVWSRVYYHYGIKETRGNTGKDEVRASCLLATATQAGDAVHGASRHAVRFHIF